MSVGKRKLFSAKCWKLAMSRARCGKYAYIAVFHSDLSGTRDICSPYADTTRFKWSWSLYFEHCLRNHIKSFTSIYIKIRSARSWKFFLCFGSTCRLSPRLFARRRFATKRGFITTHCAFESAVWRVRSDWQRDVTRSRGSPGGKSQQTRC
jgi:hypothetical protein